MNVSAGSVYHSLVPSVVFRLCPLLILSGDWCRWMCTCIVVLYYVCVSDTCSNRLQAILRLHVFELVGFRQEWHEYVRRFVFC